MSLGGDRHDTNGEAALFDSMFEQHRNIVFSYLFGSTGDRESAMDLLQETYIRVWRHIESASTIDEANRLHWTLAIAKNVHIDWRRRRSTRPVATSQIPLTEAASYGSPDRVAEANDSLAKIDEAIRDLPDDLRTSLVLSVMEGLSSAQIGELLGVPAGTVRYRLSEARNRIDMIIGWDR